MRQICAVGRNVWERTRDIFAALGNFHDYSANNEGIRQPCSEWCPRGREKNDACGKKRPNPSIFWRAVGQDFHLNGWKLPYPVISVLALHIIAERGKNFKTTHRRRNQIIRVRQKLVVVRHVFAVYTQK